MNIIVLDTETSDLPDKGGQLLELAYNVLEPDPWHSVFAHETYVQYAGPISPMAQASNHIDPQCLAPERGAVTRDNAITLLKRHIKPDSIVVAHNAIEFDSKILVELQVTWLDTLIVARKIWPQAESHKNQVLRYWLGIKPDLSISPVVKVRHPHQALYDVATTTGILLKMLEQYTPAELLRIANTNIRLKTINFGKHKGTEFSMLPLDYLQWLRKNANDPDARYTADCVLRGI